MQLTFRFFSVLIFIGSSGFVFAQLAGIRPGINRLAGDSSIILALVAPGKTKVSVIGDFPGSEWTDNIKYQMNLSADLKTWWLQVNGLNPGTEYSFQYLVDGNLKIADPYTEKVLDPAQDAFIPFNRYPNLKPYPVGKTTGIVGVVGPKSNYAWKNKFARPDKSQLVIYEILLRDFLAVQDFNTLTDTLNYLSKLGVNAIELMPFSEFEGNESWGYNPNFFFAVDKYYGTENSLKRLIDSCHGRGIAVIMDMVLNHATNSCPLVALYWDGLNQRPAANNPWLNQTARHPFNVFNDFNHESEDTKYFASRVMEYWLTEYKIDGYRFDLSKGFTQKNNPNDVGAWSAYDASRIAIWKRYKDSIERHSPGAYVILEHFADDAEEKTLSDLGMLLWGNFNYNYNEATMGYVGNSDLTRSLYQARNWGQPALLSYMESHDEERLMYKNIQFGNIMGNYSTRNLITALERMKMAATFFLLSPGPKMIWQFGELGYDFSINTCKNGTVDNNCRLDNKPIPWHYLQDINRKSLFDWYKTLLSIRKTSAWQRASRYIAYNLIGGTKWLAYNSNEHLNLVTVGNFDVKAVNAVVQFPQSGTWYDLATNKSILINSSFILNTSLLPGEFHVYIDKSLEQITPYRNNKSEINFQAAIFPNPGREHTHLVLELTQTEKIKVDIFTIQGQWIQTLVDENIQAGSHSLPLPVRMNPGHYYIRIKTAQHAITLKWLNL